MKPPLTQYMLLGMAALARIEVMKAENRKREMDGHAPAYSEIDFFNEAESLEVLAIQAINTSEASMAEMSMYEYGKSLLLKELSPHYFKDVSHLKDIDVYRVLKLFNVTDPCVQHAVKKLLVAGGRGAGKNIERDLREAVDSINRALQMIAEDDV